MSARVAANRFTRLFMVIALLVGISMQAAEEDDLRRGQLHRAAPMVVSYLHLGDNSDDSRAARGFHGHSGFAINLYPRDHRDSFQSLRAQSLPADGSRKLHELNEVFLI